MLVISHWKLRKCLKLQHGEWHTICLLMFMRFLLILLSFIFISCSQEGTPWNPKVVKVQKVAESESELYSYEFTSGTCTTGKKEFTTLDQACSFLLDESFNNHCQKNKREALYNSNCI